MTETVRFASSDGIGRLTLASPPLNILTRAMLEDLRRHCETVRGDPTLRVVVIDAEGKHFSAGADVGEHLPPTYRDLIPEFISTMRAVLTLPCPVIAGVRGRCVGGGFELALAADMIVAAEDARFGQPEVTLGVLAPVACALLPRRCPPAVAAELLHTGRLIDVPEALRIGVVNRVADSDDLAAATHALAVEIAQHSASTLRVGKRMMNADATRLDEALAWAERCYLDELMATNDAVEGLKAFLEKRTPTWSHR